LISVESRCACELGKVRENNEDAIAFDDDSGYWIVADGMGGHVYGEVASQMAVEITAKSLSEGKTSKQAILAAHKAILERAETENDKFGMGTTIVVLTQSKKCFDVTWCGDSRAYLYDGAITQLTYDHTLVQDMVFREILTEEEAAVHPKRNLVNSSLGMIKGNLRIDVENIAPTNDGYLLLCSDGVSDYVLQPALQQIFQENSTLDKIDEAIRSAVLTTEAADNFSYIIVRFGVNMTASLLNRLFK